MRIYGNRPLKTLPGRDVRPTPAKVREALFNMWRDRLEGCRWLDLCGGNGSMGAEALCRGAGWVVGIEKWGKACRVMGENWQQFAQGEQEYQVICGDVRQKLPGLAGQVFDCIYFDPPYASDLYQPTLEAIASFHLLAPDGIMAAEYEPHFWTPPPQVQQLTLTRQKVYGNSAIAFYQEEGV
ncbi:16S rRNA (guanine(966)-N(2))-methyltransferase RsmD [Spirulina subsalsa]|uniref:16S rRNA (guanine(966)-N(2))-methyltransferase RsmD n=1 Tax=Spirulina subsalsa TaxID=54311 RepID=UPI0003002398|nr:16S rRNA (guanine(966)-N(2))-methyltransferase RsmD [Spirulina subsalsa]